MKKLGFEQQGNFTYLVYELEPEDNVDSMSLGMIMNNRIPGLAPATLTQINDKKRIKYDVTARVPAAQYLLGIVNKKRLLGVFGGIVRAILSAEDYMIDSKTIPLDLGSIFSDVATADTVLLCFPVTAQEAEPIPDSDLRSFFKNILFNAQYDERENRDYVAELMSYLNGTPTFSLTEFKKILDYLMVESVPKELQPQPGPAVAGARSWSAAVQPVSPAGPIDVGHPQQSPVQQYPVQQPPVQQSPVQQPPVQQPPVQQPPVQQSPVPMQSASAPTAAPQSQNANQISLFYLLQHYNKDNAAAYKAQKEAKKAEKKPKKKVEAKRQEQQGIVGFAVPGQAEIPNIHAEGYPAPQGDQQPVLPRQSAPQAPPPYSVPQIDQQPVPQMPSSYSTPQMDQQPTSQTVPPYSVHYPTQRPVQTPPAVYAANETLYFSENEGDETVLLGHESQAQRLMPYLVRKRNNERIPINKECFRLGRDAEYNDYAVTDNRYIGHGHCHIIIRDGEYFVVDDNSKNHTKVNGKIIAPGAEVKIAHGYTICLADEDFEFRLY